MRRKPFTKTWAKKFLAATRKTIRSYENGTHDYHTDSCAFCIEAKLESLGDVSATTGPCTICPWVVFRKKTCMGVKKSPWTCTKRTNLSRLKSWEKKLIEFRDL